MPNYALLATGQQAVTTAATALPSVIPQNPLGSVLSGGAVRGEGAKVILTCTKASTASLFYGGPGVTTATGKEIAPAAQDTIKVNDLAQLNVIAAANGTSTASWSVTADP